MYNVEPIAPTRVTVAFLWRVQLSSLVSPRTPTHSAPSMGIPQLLPFVKSIAQPVHLSELKGKTVAIDVSGWLHRGLFSCALEVESGQPTDKFLDIALRCLELFATHDVRPPP